METLKKKSMSIINLKIAIFVIKNVMTKKESEWHKKELYFQSDTNKSEK